MERSEDSVWSLAGGALCVFVLAVVLKSVAVPVVLAVLAVAVGLWSVRARVWAGAALGGIAWLLLTGFEVGGDGDLVFTGAADVARLGLLVACGVAGSLAGRLPAISYKPRDGSPPGGDGPEWVHRSTGVSDDRYRHALVIGRDGWSAVPPVPAPGEPTKEARDV